MSLDFSLEVDGILNHKTQLTIILTVVLLFFCLPLQVASQESLSMSIHRNVGMAFGNYIQGTFTLSGSGPEAVDNLTVYFNGEQVHFVIGNTITWLFNTGDYAQGSTNITLYGIDGTGTTYAVSQQWNFIGTEVGGIITIVIVVLVVVLVLAKYGPRLMKMRKK
jgi:hypothetical protein